MADFGQGFYSTTNVHQAQQWANRRYQVRRRHGVASAAVVRFDIDQEAIASLDHLAFVRQDLAPNSDYWQLVAHCRRGNDHGRVGARQFYDVVYGPVSMYPQFLVITDADQISFHTDSALGVLQGATVVSQGDPVY